MKENNFCNNCGKHGHLFHQCKNPITSIGIIVVNKEEKNKKRKYLMIRRKDSLGYVDFMRGKYILYNKRYLLNLLNIMTKEERNKLLFNNFDDLWKELWGEYVGVQYRGEEKSSKEKFNTLKLGVRLSNDEYNLESLINMCTNFWKDPEWGFPKGRRNFQEKDLTCALREFEEETGYIKNSLKIIQNFIPIEEIFTGSNYKSYKHKYFLAFMDEKILPINNFQKSEVSEVKWMTYKDCLEIIRPYNLERIDVLKNVNRIIENYTFL